jgi:hypothetical protein
LAERVADVSEEGGALLVAMTNEQGVPLTVPRTTSIDGRRWVLCAFVALERRGETLDDLRNDVTAFVDRTDDHRDWCDDTRVSVVSVEDVGKKVRTDGR